MCIRDRVSTQSTWGQSKTLKTQMASYFVILALCLTAVAHASNPYPKYDRCDPDWVKIIQKGQYYDCANPDAANPYKGLAATSVAIANILEKYGITVKGTVGSPAVIGKFIAEGQEQGRWDTIGDVFHALGLDVSAGRVNGLKKELEQGHDAIAQAVDQYLILNVEGDTLQCLDSRGKTISVALTTVKDEILFVKRKSNQ
eukprot:TRINITY_DN4428_c0_g1_i1.p2 TRINITY_DN4428_c0_g1~~TRINITY_DN4428_c0_g1_i1.p2  ORF type:complete len:200 (+),score=53.37 TRINITY_DN4428_c0_g1_i1:66-665(+)